MRVSLRKITGTSATFYVDDAAIAKWRAENEDSPAERLNEFREEYGASADGLTDQDILDINDDPNRGEYEDPEGQPVSDDEVRRVLRASGADKAKAKAELAGMTATVDPDKAQEPKPGQGGLTEGQEAKIEAAPLDAVQQGMKDAAQHRAAVEETMAQMGEAYAPFAREENDPEKIKAQFAEIGSKLIKASEKLETHYFSQVLILGANWLDLLINTPGEYAGNAWASAVTIRTNPAGKRVPHLGFDKKTLKEDIRTMLGANATYRTERKQGPNTTLDNIISPAVKGAVLVQTRHNGACLAWFTKRGLYIDDAATTPEKMAEALANGAYRTIAMPSCNMIPNVKKTKTSMEKNESTQLIPMMRGYIDAQYANLVEGAKLTDFGRIAPTKDEETTNPVEALIEAGAHTLDSEQACQLVAAVEHWVTNPDLRQRLRKDGSLRAAMFSLSEKLDALYNADGEMYSEKELDAIRTGMDKLPSQTGNGRQQAHRRA